MNVTDLKNKKIGIIGFGQEGRAVAEFLSAHGIPYTVLDKARLNLNPGSQPLISGPNYLQHLIEFEVLFRSPGVSVLLPEIVEAKKAGVIITSQIKFFFENCPAKIIGVTGTKGKGTTSKLIYDILQAAGINSYLGGNFGVPVMDLLEKLQPSDYVVLELSSFQLQDLEQSPHIAVVLMVTSEHLDYHKDTNEYVEAKTSITKFQTKEDFAVINFNYPSSVKIGEQGEAQRFYVQTAQDLSELQIRNGVFGEQASGGIYFVDGGELKKFLEIKDLVLRGFHNVENVGAAMQVAKILEIKENAILETIKNFKGLEHRLELVTEKQGIKFYNDSFGTTPETSLAAIRAFTEPEIVIMGGFDKKGDYKMLAEETAKQKNIKAAILIGTIASQLEENLRAAHFGGLILTGAKNMQEIFRQIRQCAQSGDVVLLAPATSSFDMFKNYKERGTEFKKFANNFDA